jgi:hypothetical protein
LYLFIFLAKTIGKSAPPPGWEKRKGEKTKSKARENDEQN